MKAFFLFILSVIISAGIARSQPLPPRYTNGKQVSVTGAVMMPALLSMNILNLANAPVRFKNGIDYNEGKTVSSFCTVEIKGNVPWQLAVAASSSHFVPLTISSSENIPVNIVSLRKSGSNNYIPLSTTEQVLFQNNNNAIHNYYGIDLKADPSWQYPGGTYSIDIIFTLTPQ